MKPKKLNSKKMLPAVKSRQPKKTKKCCCRVVLFKEQKKPKVKKIIRALELEPAKKPLIQKNLLVERQSFNSSRKLVDSIRHGKTRQINNIPKANISFHKKEISNFKLPAISSYSWLKTMVMRTTTLLLIVMINYLALSGIGYTHAYFNDEEISEDNSFTDGILDFRMTYDCDSGEDIIDGFTPDDPIVRNHTVYQEGTLNFQYEVQPINFSGNLHFCNQLMLTADLGGELVYSGPLVDFYHAAVFSTSTYLWLYTLSLPPGLGPEYQHQTCSFTAVYRGWQENIPTPEQGFYDVEKNHYNITSGRWHYPKEDNSIDIIPLTETEIIPDETNEPILSDLGEQLGSSEAAEEIIDNSLPVGIVELPENLTIEDPMLVLPEENTIDQHNGELVNNLNNSDEQNGNSEKDKRKDNQGSDNQEIAKPENPEEINIVEVLPTIE